MTESLTDFNDALILVIDDEDTQRLLTRDCLEEQGFRVDEASNGQDGVDRIRSARPDLILLDVMMPGMDGFAVCEQLRADPAFAHIPVIIVTGREDTEDIQKGFAVGATDFLTKPLVWNLLPSRIRYVLRTSRLENDLRIAKETAEKASEAKTVLLATLGHELRTPLNAIIGFSDLMMQASFGPLGAPQYRDYVGDINASGEQLLNAINDILEIVNSESGRLDLNVTKIDVASLARDAIREFASEADASGVEISSDVVEEGAHIYGDERRLRRALYNLVSNALKFTPQGGAIRIGWETSENGGLALSVCDNGIGVSPEDLPRIVEPFEQADSRLARNYEGLGIPVARAMVQLHGGELQYESALGLGTTAKILLPPEIVVCVDDIAVAG